MTIRGSAGTVCAKAFLIAAFVSIVVSGCETSGSAVSESRESTAEKAASQSYSEVRQVDDAGRRLPFKTYFPDRWSTNNDGTDYEPCTAIQNDLLERLNLDPGSVKDVAVANHQTARGCQWRYRNQAFAQVSQHVGNMNGGVTGIAQYKTRNRDFRWFPDQVIGGRTVGVFTSSVDTCDTILESGTAFVFTDVILGTTGDDVSENCRRALAFTRATIDLIPR